MLVFPLSSTLCVKLVSRVAPAAEWTDVRHPTHLAMTIWVDRKHRQLQGPCEGFPHSHFDMSVFLVILLFAVYAVADNGRSTFPAVMSSTAPAFYHLRGCASVHLLS